MRKTVGFALSVLSLLAASQVSADGGRSTDLITGFVQVIPANPTTADSVTIVPLGCGTLSVTRIGNLFQIHLNGCPFEPIVNPVPLGILPAGSYQYEIYNGPDTTNLYGTGSFVVAPSVPALSRAALIGLCAVLVAAGLLLIGRQS